MNDQTLIDIRPRMPAISAETLSEMKQKINGGATPLKHRGAMAEILAVAFLLSRGYEVFRNQSQHGIADLIAWKDGQQPKLIDVKAVSLSYNAGRDRSYVSARKLTPDQIRCGVSALWVFEDEVVWDG